MGLNSKKLKQNDSDVTAIKSFTGGEIGRYQSLK